MSPPTHLKKLHSGYRCALQFITGCGYHVHHCTLHAVAKYPFLYVHSNVPSEVRACTIAHCSPLLRVQQIYVARLKKSNLSCIGILNFHICPIQRIAKLMWENFGLK